MMKRKILSILLTLTMTLTLLPATAMAEDVKGVQCDGRDGCDHKVAAIYDGSAGENPGEYHYDTLQAAITNGTNDYYGNFKLLDDVKEDIVVGEGQIAGKYITLDLNGHTITNAKSDTITVQKRGKLTITGSGTVDNVTDGRAPIYNNGTCTLSGGNYTRSKEAADNTTTSSGGNSYYNILNHGEMTIGSGVSVTSSGHFSSLVANGYYDYSAKDKGDRTAYIDNVGQAAPKLTIEGGTFRGGINTIKNDDNATLTIKDGMFSNVTQAVVQNNNIAEISGGTFDAGDGFYALQNRNFNGTMNKGNLTVTGGEFKGNVYATEGATTDIRGGKFTANVKAYIPSDYVQSADGTVAPLGESTAAAKIGDTYYATLAAAIDAAKDGETVVMVNDTTVSEEIDFSGKKITLDLNGKTITAKFNDYYSVIEAQGTAATLTIEDNSTGKTGKIISNHYGLTASGGGNLVVNSGTIETGDGAALSGNNQTGDMNLTVNGGTLTTNLGPAIYMPSEVNLTITDGTINGGVSLRMGQVNISGGTINSMTADKAAYIDMPEGKVGSTPAYAYSGNVWFPDALYVIGGTYTSDNTEHGNSLNLNITGGTFNCTNGKGSGIAIYDLGKVEQTMNVTISGETVKVGTNSDQGAYAVISHADIMKRPGAAADSNYGKSEFSGKVSSSLSAGYYTSDPSDYCATGMTGVASGDAAYPYTVGTKAADAKPATVDSASVPAKATSNSEVVKKAAEEIKGAEMVDPKAAEAAAKDLANKNTIASDTKVDGNKTVVEQLKKATGNTSTSANDVAIVYQTYVDVAVSDAKKDSTTDKITELEVNLTPMYRVVATTKDVVKANQDIVVKGEESGNTQANAVVIEKGKKLTLPEAEYEIRLNVPNDFAAEINGQVSVKHTKDNGQVEYYTGTVIQENGQAYVTFTTKGFSPFVISAAVASIDGVMYPSLAEAVANVTDGQTIKLEADCDETVTVSRTVKFTLKTNSMSFTGSINPGSRTTLSTSSAGTNKTEYSFTYSAPSSGGSSSGSTTYTITVNKAKNGDVDANRKTAAKGTTVTLTVSPDKGYTLETLSVLDKSGKEIKLTEKNGKYTFTMPASNVEVKATFMDDNTMLNFFVDVKASDYFYDAVLWAAEKGITGGTSATTFNPNGICTRAQAVTFLWRAAGSPAPKSTAMPFTDVAADSYYERAVLWAVENGITKGTSDTTFSPNATCSRAQIVTFLWRSQKSPAAGSVNPFTDVSADAYYADAVLWAVKESVTSGTTATTFSPNADCTRAQIVTFIYRALAE